MIKGAPVTPEASAISGASATTEVQNNSAEVQNNSASASDPVDAEAPAKILIPLEHWVKPLPSMINRLQLRIYTFKQIVRHMIAQV